MSGAAAPEPRECPRCGNRHHQARASTCWVCYALLSGGQSPQDRLASRMAAAMSGPVFIRAVSAATVLLLGGIVDVNLMLENVRAGVILAVVLLAAAGAVFAGKGGWIAAILNGIAMVVSTLALIVVAGAFALFLYCTGAR